ncbi:MAG: hypothetical protein QW199_01165 [Candidatus Pacearchaeota archaeon]
MKKRGSKKSKNKKAAFEMSITTIVILVIAMIMLILGIMLVRKIMCGGMNIAEETLQGAKSQISKLFSEQTGEIRCAGSAGSTIVTIVPDRPNVVGCLYSPDVTTTYTLNIQDANFKPKLGNPQKADLWFVTKTNTKTVVAGSSDVGGVIVRPPKGTPAGDLIVTVEITKSTSQPGEKYTDTLTFEVKSLGFLRETAC